MRDASWLGSVGRSALFTAAGRSAIDDAAAAAVVPQKEIAGEQCRDPR